MTDWFFQPENILGIQHAAALYRLCDAKCLIVVDHQLDAIAEPVADGMYDGEIPLHGRITEAQLDDAKPARDKLLCLVRDRFRLIHQTKSGTVVSGNGLRPT